MTAPNSAHVVLTNVRLSYTHLDKPYSQNPNQPAKYSCTILVPKQPAENKTKIDRAIAAATQKAIEKFGKAFPRQPRISVHDGDGTRPSDNQPFGDECHGHWVFTATSKTPVTVVDTSLQPILQPTDIYSGMYANVGVTFFGYNNPQNKGIGVALDNIQKIAEGDPLGGQRPSANDDFGGLSVPTTPTAPAPGGYPAYAPQVAAPGYGYTPQAAAPSTTGYPQYAPQAPAAVDPLTGQPIR